MVIVVTFIDKWNQWNVEFTFFYPAIAYLPLTLVLSDSTNEWQIYIQRICLSVCVFPSEQFIIEPCGIYVVVYISPHTHTYIYIYIYICIHYSIHGPYTCRSCNSKDKNQYYSWQFQLQICQSDCIIMLGGICSTWQGFFVHTDN